MSADCTSEMLIYIRHGTSALQSKSAEKLSEAESKAPSPQLCQVSGLPDQRMAGFGTSDQKTDISLRKQNLLGLLHVKIDSTDSSGPRSSYNWWSRRAQWNCFETRDNWCLASSLWDKDRNSGAPQWNSSPRIDLSMCVSTSACLSICVCLFLFSPSIIVSFLMGDHNLSEYCQENIKD